MMAKKVWLMAMVVSVAVAFGLWAAVTVQPQQVADTSYRPPIETPTYSGKDGNDPVVAIDEAHFNFHTMEGRYRPFAELLKADGYVVRPMTSQFSAQSLQDVDILVIVNPQAKSTAAQEPNYRLPVPPAFTDAEIVAVRDWVEDGGSLFLAADHMPWPGAASNLAAAFGVHMLNGYAVKEGADTQGVFTFRRSGSSERLTEHPITNSKTAAEKVNKVVSFEGSAFRIDESANAQPLLILGPDVVSIMARHAWKWDSDTRRVPVEGWFQGAVMRVGEGRVAVFGEAAMFDAQRLDGRPMGMNAPNAQENYRFALSVFHWLSGRLG